MKRRTRIMLDEEILTWATAQSINLSKHVNELLRREMLTGGRVSTEYLLSQLKRVRKIENAIQASGAYSKQVLSRREELWTKHRVPNAEREILRCSMQIREQLSKRLIKNLQYECDRIEKSLGRKRKRSKKVS